MFCTKCGGENKPETKFCIHCGAPMYQAPAPVQEPAPVPPVEAYRQPQPAVAVPVCPPAEEKPKKSGKTSLILGIISLVTSIWIVISLPLSIIGLIFGVKSDRNSKSRKWGIATNAAALGMSLISVVLVMVLVVTAAIADGGTTTYYGNGYTLEYNNDWSIATIGIGTDVTTEALTYADGEVLVFETNTPLELSKLGIAFETGLGKRAIFKAVYDGLTEDEAKYGRKYSLDDADYFEMDNGMYCFYYPYTATDGGDQGMSVRLVSAEDNAIIFLRTVCYGDLEDGQNIVFELLETMEIRNE